MSDHSDRRSGSKPEGEGRSRGFFERSLTWILIALGLLVLYGSMIFGIFPGESGVSWQSHFFGFAAGIIAAWAMFPRNQKLFST